MTTAWTPESWRAKPITQVPDYPDMAKLKEELGDTLFYLTDIARQYGIELAEVPEGNVAKLNKRFSKAKCSVMRNGANHCHRPCISPMTQWSPQSRSSFGRQTLVQ